MTTSRVFLSSLDYLLFEEYRGLSSLITTLLPQYGGCSDIPPLLEQISLILSTFLFERKTLSVGLGVELEEYGGGGGRRFEVTSWFPFITIPFEIQ